MRFSIFKKKEKATPIQEAKKEPSLLEQLCGDDKALYEDLSWTMYLDPRNKGTYAEAVEKAEALEKEGKTRNVAGGYRHAGALAMYEANVDGVKRAFGKATELSERKYPRIPEVPEKAIEIVRQFYEKTLKSEKETEKKSIITR